MVYESGGLRSTGSPMNFSATPVSKPAAPPALGADGERILTSVLGYTAAQVSELRTAKVIA
jgi:crotonobetainyl-CoA:carnitine CoA-transferase CaiB-like acyl-CoA transferase